MQIHKSVLPNEIIAHLPPTQHNVYLDVTFGGGGHTRRILTHDPTATVYALDWDREMLDRYAPSIKETFLERFIPIWGNFALLYRLVKQHKLPIFNAIIADFGCAQPQLFEKDGFSFFSDTPLDMRMSKAHYQETAAMVVNTYSLDALTDLLHSGGEERWARKIAQAILHARKQRKITTTGALARIISDSIGKRAHTSKQGLLHPATRAFQALRIHVNHELDNIISFLPAAVKQLAPKGRLLCITFHSLEDRLVKTYLRDHTNLLHTYTKKPILPSEDEVTGNAAARSAKLRVAEKRDFHK